MFLVSDQFVKSSHGSLGCITCHGGENVSDKSLAHAGMEPYPSRDFAASCAECHSEVTDKFAQSSHFTLAGMKNGLLEFTDYSQLSESLHHEETFNTDCYKCHATCGDCHVSRPKNYSQGLVDQHNFFGTPPMDETCYGCHNARNGGEFMGTVGFGGDVHHELGMTCMDCHPQSNFHGTGTAVENMWAEELPSCLDCHEDKDPAVAKDEFHSVHGDALSCQVCHAQANNNCFECHLDPNEDGSKLVSSSQMKLMFRIGYNPEVTEQRPYKYVVLRHVPSQSNMLDAVGENMLPNYDEKSNWKYSPTHNVQKHTFQNESCQSCHDNTRIWLRPADLTKTDSKANQDLIPELPPKLGR